MTSSHTRRDFLQLATAVAATGAASRASLATAAASTSAKDMTVGIATLGFSTYSNLQLAQELAQEGLKTVQLFLNQTDSRYWRYNGRSDVTDLTPARCREIAATYRDAGIELHSLGVYTNLIHPDPAEREANLAYFDAMMQIAVEMGIQYLITEAGHYHPEEAAPQVPHHFQEKTWATTVAAGKRLAKMADARGVTVLFEPFFRGFLASAKRARLFLEDVDSPRIRALLDPANLQEVNDLDEMFAQLKPWIDCLHAKDRKLHVDRGVAAGQGDLDYPRFVELAAEHTPQAPLILEYVGPDNFRQARQHLLNAMGK